MSTGYIVFCFLLRWNELNLIFVQNVLRFPERIIFMSTDLKEVPCELTELNKKFDLLIRSYNSFNNFIFKFMQQSIVFLLHPI
jgi:hypothetical protein